MPSIVKKLLAPELAQPYAHVAPILPKNNLRLREEKSWPLSLSHWRCERDLVPSPESQA